MMKAKSTLIAATFLLGAALTFSSCKKDPKKDPNCLLISATNSSDTTVRTNTFAYNSNNKITQIANLYGGITTLNYSGNTVNILLRDADTVIRQTTLTLDEAGRISREDIRFEGLNPLMVRTNYSYGTNGELVRLASQTSFTSNFDNSPEYITTVTNTNGNVTSMVNDNRIVKMEYLEDQASRAGDYNDIVQRGEVGNNFYLFNKNLVKSVTEINGIARMSYTFDENNNIAAMKVIRDSNTVTVSYKYDCK